MQNTHDLLVGTLSIGIPSLIGPKDMLNCVEYIYIVNTKYKGHGAITWLKRG